MSYRGKRADAPESKLRLCNRPILGLKRKPYVTDGRAGRLYEAGATQITRILSSFI